MLTKVLSLLDYVHVCSPAFFAGKCLSGACQSDPVKPTVCLSYK